MGAHSPSAATVEESGVSRRTSASSRARNGAGPYSSMEVEWAHKEGGAPQSGFSTGVF